MSERIFSLDNLTVVGVSPDQLVDVAAEAGFGAVAPFRSGSPELKAELLEKGSPSTVAMAKRLRETGVRLNIVDGFAIVPGLRVEDYKASMALAAELGARKVVVLDFGEGGNQSFDLFCGLAEQGHAEGLRVLLEFTPLSKVASLNDALDWITRARQPNTGLMVDLLHLMQSGGSPADLRKLDPALIGGAQLCDGPLNPSFETYAYNAFYERQAPGAGQLPVAEFLAALPADLVVGLEIPQKSLVDQGVSHLDRAKGVLKAARETEARAAKLG